MPNTSVSLLNHLRENPTDESWQQLYHLYAPLIQRWLSYHLQIQQDVDDLVQEVLLVVMKKLPGFEHQERVGSFRAWLKAITRNCLRDFWKSQRIRPVATGKTEFAEQLQQLKDPESILSRLWNEEHDQYVLQGLLEMIKPQFEPKTWEAFHKVAREGRSAEEVARELDLTVNAVFIAKSRVLKRLKQAGAGLLDDV